MGDLSDRQPEAGYRTFVARWLAPVVAVFLRAVRDPVLAYDLATETLAAARLQLEPSPSGDAEVEQVLRLGARILDAAVERRRIPATERRRGRQPSRRQLTVTEQHEIAELAEQTIELPEAAREAADALSRMAPPPHVLAQLRGSDLVLAEPLPVVADERDRRRHGA